MLNSPDLLTTMCKSLLPMVLACAFQLLLPTGLFSQGETTSAIVGQVSDVTSAPIPGAILTITNRETGLERTVKTDAQGRFDFPQLSQARIPSK